MPDFKEITRDELKKKMDSGDDFILLDVLGKDSYESIHLPGALSVDAHEEKSAFLEAVSDIVDDTSQDIVVYCSSFSCQLSPKAAGMLAEAGYTNVYDFEGGLKDWAAGGFPFEGERAEEIAEKLSE